MSEVTTDREHDLYVAGELPDMAEDLRRLGSEYYDLAEHLEGLRSRILRKWGTEDGDQS